jgi:hypothetical protein
MENGMTEELKNAPTSLVEKVNLRAVECLEPLLQELEFRQGDEEHEVEYIGDLYARLIVAVYMGFQPKLLADDAEGAALKLMKLTGIEMEEVEDDAD